MECEFSNIIIVMLRHAELPVWQIVLNYAKTHVIWERGTCYISFYQSHAVTLIKLLWARLLVGARVVNLLCCQFWGLCEPVSTPETSYSASVDVLIVSYCFKKVQEFSPSSLWRNCVITPLSKEVLLECCVFTSGGSLIFLQECSFNTKFLMRFLKFPEIWSLPVLLVFFSSFCLPP